MSIAKLYGSKGRKTIVYELNDSEDMIEVAIASVEAVFDWKKWQKEERLGHQESQELRLAILQDTLQW